MKKKVTKLTSKLIKSYAKNGTYVVSVGILDDDKNTFKDLWMIKSCGDFVRLKGARRFYFNKESAIRASKRFHSKMVEMSKR